MSETADVLDGAFWDYDPEADLLSPLVTTDRYFRDFPWESESRPDSDPGSATKPGTATAASVNTQ